MSDPRDLHREYVKLPQLVQTGVQMPAVPLEPEDWDGMRRLLEALSQAVSAQDGVSGTFTISGSTLVFLKGKLISIS